MKRYLGTVVVITLLGVLSGCGDDPEDRADDSATQEQTTAAEPRVIDIVSGVAAGGDVAETPTVIEDGPALTRYVAQFRSPTLVEELSLVVEAADPAVDRVIGLAVIEVSCDEPPSATITEEHGAFVVTAGKVVSPHPECYAPVTSVAVLELPA